MTEQVIETVINVTPRVKTLRNQLYAISQELLRVESTREVSIAVTKIQEAEMWLSQELSKEIK